MSANCHRSVSRPSSPTPLSESVSVFSSSRTERRSPPSSPMTGECRCYPHLRYALSYWSPSAQCMDELQANFRSCLNFTDENDEVLISGFGRRGKAKGDIPGVRFKVVKVSGVGLLALWKEKK
jgi:hypothetical protein